MRRTVRLEPVAHDRCHYGEYDATAFSAPVFSLKHGGEKIPETSLHAERTVYISDYGIHNRLVVFDFEENLIYRMHLWFAP